MDISEVGINIKKLREKKKWSLNKLHQECGVGYATLHDIENGRSQNLNTTNVEKVAKALNVTIDELLGLEVIEYVVCDLENTLKQLLLSDELEIEGILVNDKEKEKLQDYFDICIELIKKKRGKLLTDEGELKIYEQIYEQDFSKKSEPNFSKDFEPEGHLDLL